MTSITVELKHSWQLVHANLSPPPILIRSHIFCPFYVSIPHQPSYFCNIPQERMARSVEREWCCHSDVSVCLSHNTESILLLLAWDATSSLTASVASSNMQTATTVHYTCVLHTWVARTLAVRKKEEKIHSRATFCRDSLLLINMTETRFRSNTTSILNIWILLHITENSLHKHLFRKENEKVDILTFSEIWGLHNVNSNCGPLGY